VNNNIENIQSLVTAVGDNAKISDTTQSNSTQSQTHYSGVEKADNLLQLANELSKLLQELKGKSTNVEHYATLSEIAQAEQAAKENNMSRVMEHLKSAGLWALNIAKEIGVPVAVEFLKQALGLSK
jgi:hypothetical protein